MSATDDKPRKWVGPRLLQRMQEGVVTGIDPVDVAAVTEGQAHARMRNYSRRVHVWEIDDD